MTATGFLFLFFVVWIVVGLSAAVVMARRGHDLWTWTVLGMLMGPLVLTIAVRAMRQEARLENETRMVHTGAGGPGEVSVLIGTDGSPDADIAIDTVRRLFGARLGHIALATVVDFDAADLPERDRAFATARARRLLDAAAELLAPVEADEVVLTGRPSDALLSYALEHDVDVLVVGQRGAGLTPALVGSTAERLVRQRQVPVLLTGVPECVHI